MIRKIRAEGLATILIAGGEDSPKQSPQGRLKFEALLKAIKAMDYDAVAAGRCDMEMEEEDYGALERLKATGIPLVTLNVTYRGKRLSERPVIIERGDVRVGIFGLFITGPAPGSLRGEIEIHSPDDLIAGAIAYTREKADFNIAVLAGPLEDVRSFVERNPGMDLVIISQLKKTLIQPIKVKDSLLLSTGDMGKYLGRVDVEFKRGRWTFRPMLHPLRDNLKEDPTMTQIYADYKEAVKKMAVEEAQRLRVELEGRFPPLPSAGDCRDCHDELHEAWKKTPHARAITTLANRNEHYNPECVVCHTTGYLKGGFITLDTTPGYAGIQCAACHGPMEGHIAYHSGGGKGAGAEPVPPPDVTDKVCLQCHTRDRDAEFNFENDKRKVH